ncbi:MAG: PAS domain-containing protein [Flavobacterium sp.]|nr:PAS domain-containing protein [Flavobacterium sp.]
MEHYDNACAKYYNSLNIKCLPLTTWEFRNEHFSEAIIYKKLLTKWNTKQDYLKQAHKENRELIVTDKNFRIVFVSDTISNISGYRKEEILGKTPRMFQGEATSLATRQKIKIALTQQKPFKEVILNYKKNGESYWCEIEAFPIFDKKGEFINYVALEKIAS